MSKIVRSAPSTEKSKLETLYSPNKGIPKVIKNHEDRRTVTVKVNHHPKYPFGVHQTYLQELKSYLIQSTYVIILSH
jgi:hypothetical protein